MTQTNVKAKVSFILYTKKLTLAFTLLFVFSTEQSLYANYTLSLQYKYIFKR